MDRLRHRTLELYGGILTKEEQEEGWHFCYDWDYMLVQQGNTEGHADCDCTLSLYTRPKETKESS